MTVIVVILVLAVVGLGGSLAVVVSRRPTFDTAAVAEQVARTNQALMQPLLERGATEISGKAALIDHQATAMRDQFEHLTSLVRDLEHDRMEKFGQLGSQLAQQQAGMADLLNTTQSLREALSSSKARGQWGERIAEDVLRLAGLVEGASYVKQRAVEGGVPDFTFLLPEELVLHMDAKFPLDNYLRYLEAESDLEEKRHRDAFLRDVRGHVRSLASRTYINPAAGTVNFVLLFIPNEQLYGFIHEHDATIVDAALRQGVVLCSPVTLFAVVALVRQTAENLNLARTSNEILGHLAQFEKQWTMFVAQMEKLGRGIKSVSNSFEDLDGTRRRQLERKLEDIDRLRREEQLSLVEDDGDDDGTIALEA